MRVTKKILDGLPTSRCCVTQDAAEFAHKNYMDIYDAEVLTGWLARYNN